MELLNNIWNALSTPNEGLMNIIMILGSFVEAILSFLVFTTLLNISSTHKQKIICNLKFYLWLTLRVILKFLPIIKKLLHGRLSMMLNNP